MLKPIDETENKHKKKLYTLHAPTKEPTITTSTRAIASQKKNKKERETVMQKHRRKR